MKQNRPLSFIGLSSGLGGNETGCGKAPSFLNERLRFSCFTEITTGSDKRNDYEIIANSNLEFAKAVYNLAKKKEFFVSLGGDHSCAIGTWSGVSEAYREQGEIGLLWIDAHMDSHTSETSESKNIHGMPLAALLGHGNKLLTEILSPNPKILPQNIVLIGIRSYEKAEASLLDKLGVKIYYMQEIKERGFNNILKEAIQKVSQSTVGYGISFDLDSLDPLWIQAVGTPVPGGLDLEEFISGFQAFREKPPLAFEMVEYNPDLDSTFLSFKVIQRILDEVRSLAR